MGHVWKRQDTISLAAKGSPERILTLCILTAQERKLAEEKILEMSQKGLRVIAVAEMIIDDVNSVPASLLECKLKLCGLVGLADPPRESVKEDIKNCTKAGIRVVMILSLIHI